MPSKLRVYIASPMSQGDQIKNFYEALRWYRILIDHGFAPLCPQLTFLVEGMIREEHDTWLSLDLPWVQVADAVFRLPGASKGADQEEEEARLWGVKVFHDFDELRVWKAQREEDGN